MDRSSRAETAYYTDAQEGSTAGFGRWEDLSDAGNTSSRSSIRSLDVASGSDAAAPQRSLGHRAGTKANEKIIFLSEDGKRTWQEQSFIFTDESALFLDLVQFDIANRSLGLVGIDPITRLPGLQRDRKRKRLQYRLMGISPWDFDSLLSGLKPRLGEEIPFEQLCPLLVLSTDWGFDHTRHFAIKEIPKHPDRPIPRILLSRRASVPEWLILAYITLATDRLSPLSKFEADLIGLDAFHVLSQAREKIMERRMNLIVTRPSVLLGKTTFWHGGCWLILSAAWRRALTENWSAGMSPREAMLREVTLATNGRRLCKNCESPARITQWLDLRADEKIARELIEGGLGKTFETWVPSTFSSRS